MENTEYLKDIQDIKTLMNRSTQVLSLSGLAGVLAGIYALIGSYIVFTILQGQKVNYESVSYPTFRSIIYVAIVVLALSLVTAFILTYLKATKSGETIWNSATRRLMINFLIPLFTGGIFSLILLRDHYYELIASVTLIFYGLSCINASKFTFRDVRYLGVTIVILGLISAAFPGYALYFWALGFGVCHIVYGGIMHYKYDRK